MTSQEQQGTPAETFPCTIEGCTHEPFATPGARTNHENNAPHDPPAGAQPLGDESPGPGEGATPPEAGDTPPEQPEAGPSDAPADAPAEDEATPVDEPAPEIHTAQEPAGPCRMCSLPIDVGENYQVINIGRRVHDGDCADQARAAGYFGPTEA